METIKCHLIKICPHISSYNLILKAFSINKCRQNITISNKLISIRYARGNTILCRKATTSTLWNNSSKIIQNLILHPTLAASLVLNSAVVSTYPTAECKIILLLTLEIEAEEIKRATLMYASNLANNICLSPTSRDSDKSNSYLNRPSKVTQEG